MITKKQHYVQRKYLKNWKDNKKIFYLLKDKNKICQSVDLMNVANEKFFYTLYTLSDNEIYKLLSTIKQFNYLNNYYVYYMIYLSNILSNFDDCKKELFEKIMTNIENKAQSLYKCKSINDIKTIYNRELLYFIFVQYCRTNNILQNFDDCDKKYFNYFIILMPLLFSINVYEFYTIYFVINEYESFITGDQPVINIEDKNFYYPLSPKYALLLIKETNKDNNKFNEFRCNKNLINYFNNEIYNNSLRFVFSNNENILKQYVK